MTTHLTPCEEVLAVARGDERDSAEIRLHLDRCAGCREEVGDFRLLAQAARSALMTAPATATAVSETLDRARRRPLLGSWPLQAALATAATAALVFGLTRATPQPQTQQLVFDVSDETATESRGISWEITGPGGTRRGDLPIAEPQFVLDTVAVNVMVLDTF